MVDSHANYVPDITNIAKDISIRFTNTNVIHENPDQLLLFCLFDSNSKLQFERIFFISPLVINIPVTLYRTTVVAKELLDIFIF